MASDLDRLQGTWHISALEIDGVKRPKPELAGFEITIKGKTFTSTGAGQVYKGKVDVKATTKPKSIDLLFTDGPQKGTRNLGIYKLDKNEWVFCLAMQGTVRPTKFATKGGTGLALETLQRGPAPVAKAAKKPTAKSTKSEATPAAADGPASPIDGEWKMIAAVFDGKPMDQGMVAWCKRVTKGGVTTVTAGPQTMISAKFSVDASAKPATIEYQNLEGTHKGQSQPGIFDITDGLLRICMSPPGKPRPDVFVSKPGDGRSFTSWRLL